MTKKMISLLLTLGMLSGMTSNVFAANEETLVYEYEESTEHSLEQRDENLIEDSLDVLIEDTIEEETLELNDASVSDIEDSITFRVIGGTYPTEGVSIGFASWFNDQIIDDSGYGNYLGAEYQNWIMPEELAYTEGMTAGDAIRQGLDSHGYEEGITYSLGDSRSTYVYAPACLGGYRLQCDSPQVGDMPGEAIGLMAGWLITIQRGNEFLESPGTEGVNIELLTDTVLQPDDVVIFHFCYEPDFELSNSIGANYGNGEYADYVHCFLKTLNVSAEERAAAYQFDEDVLSLGTIDRTKGEQIEMLEEKYEHFTEEQLTLIKNYQLLVAARETYDKLMDSNILTAPSLDIDSAVTVADKEAMTAKVTLAKPERSQEDKNASVLYSYSTDGITWSKWQSKNVIDGLPVGTKCYFMAKYMADDTEHWMDSGNSVVVSLYTPYVIKTRQEWLKAVQSAPRDGTKIILQIAEDVNVSQEGSFTQKTPLGSNIVMVGDGGRLISPSGGQLTNGIGIGARSTLTLKDLTYVSYYNTKTNANFGQMIWFDGDYGTVNIDNSIIYGDSLQTGRIVFSGANHCVLNIYSGSIDNISGGKAIYADMGADLTVNLKPKGGIQIEGHIYAVDGSLYPSGITSGHIDVNLVHQENYDVTSGSTLLGTIQEYGHYTYGTEYTVYDEEHLRDMNESTEKNPYDMSEYVGRYGALYIHTSEGASAVPAKLSAPEIELEDLQIDYGKVTIPQGITSVEQENAIFQYRILRKVSSYEGHEEWKATSPYKKWIFEPMSFEEELEEDCEYRLEVRFNAIGGNYRNSDAVYLTFRTGYHTKQLAAPYLSNAAERQRTSILLTAPAISDEDDTAILEYRVSVDQVNWSEWQTELLFDGLEPGTKYYFQARYKAVHYLWTDSEGSESVMLSTRAFALEAPELSRDAEVTHNSVKLLAPMASDEDPNAKVQYRISDDGETWYAEWQDSPLFESLSCNTTYYFQARYVSSVEHYKNSEASATAVFTTKLDPTHAAIVVSENCGYAGETVEMTITLKNNPGIVSASLMLEYDDEVLELVSVSNGEVFSENNFSFSDGQMLWLDASNDVTTDGVLATLIFNIKANAKPDKAIVSVTYNAGDVYDADLEDVDFDIVSGFVAVKTHILGDVDGDGSVVYLDAASLYRYLAGWTEYNEDTLDLSVADLNDDGKVNAKDATWLRRAVAGWDNYSLAAQ